MIFTDYEDYYGLIDQLSHIAYDLMYNGNFLNDFFISQNKGLFSIDFHGISNSEANKPHFNFYHTLETLKKLNLFYEEISVDSDGKWKICIDIHFKGELNED